MKIRIHDHAKAQFRAWRQSLGTTRLERSQTRKRLWAEFKATLRGDDGRHWMAFPDGYLALVEFRTTRVFFGWFTRREAIVLRLNFSPGLRGRVG